MSHRVLDVTAYTTFDFLRGSATGIDWENEGVAVMDVDADEEERMIALSVELDPTDLDRVEQHADHVYLFPEEARTLASTLREAADRVEEANESAATTSRKVSDDE